MIHHLLNVAIARQIQRTRQLRQLHARTIEFTPFFFFLPSKILYKLISSSRNIVVANFNWCGSRSWYLSNVYSSFVSFSIFVAAHLSLYTAFFYVFYFFAFDIPSPSVCIWKRVQKIQLPSKQVSNYTTSPFQNTLVCQLLYPRL